jgi:glutamate mutase epsilon subunit
MKKKNRKGDGNDPLFDIAFGISLGDDDIYENHKVEKRTQTLMEEIKNKDEIIKKLQGESHYVLKKQIIKLQDDNKKLQDIIDKSKVSEEILEKINTLKKESDKLSQIIDKLTRMK